MKDQRANADNGAPPLLCSVVVPLYNKEAYIEAALLSVLAQRYRYFEVIVVDDGSTDEGAHRVMQIGDPRIRLIRQSNAGVSIARNRGIESAQGDLVCFLDADDWYLPAYLETIVAMAKSHPHFTYYATGYYKACALDCLPLQQAIAHPTEVIDDCYQARRRRGALFCTCSVAVKTDTLVRMQPCFAPGESMGEDLDLWFRLGAESSMAYCAVPLVGYRVGLNDSLTMTQPVRTLLPAWQRLEKSALPSARDAGLVGLVRLVGRGKRGGPAAPNRLRSSMLCLVAHERTMLARVALSEGRRKDAVHLLLSGWRGFLSRPWWVTLVLMLPSPPGAIQRWTRWRSERVKNI